MVQGMAVERIWAGAPASRVTQPAPASTGFRVPDQAQAPAARSVPGAAAPATLLGLLAVQEAEGDAARNRDARRRGQLMLDELTRLQRALLAGHLGADDLHALAALAASAEVAADPMLAAAVRAVAVRARVELARLKVAARR